MTEQTKTAPPSRPQYARDSTWYPLRSWWSQPSRLFNQDFGLPPFLEAGDLSWVDIIHKRLAASCWPGYMHPPLFMPSVSGFMQQPSPKLSKAEEAELSEVRTEQYRWRVILDVGHFSPSEITLRTRAGFLEVGGKHEERPDEHGFIARCFTRKYKIPIGVDPTKIQSTLSGDGILCVEAPLPESFIPTDIIIPVQVEKETIREEGEEDGPEETAEADTESRGPKMSDSGFPEAPGFASTEPATEALERGETPLEAPGDEAHPGSSAAGTAERDEGRGGEDKTPAELTGETRPAEGADDEGRETEELPEPSMPEPSEPHETADSPVTPDTVTSDQGEHTDLAQEGGELQPAGGSGETAEELPQPEEPEAGVSPPKEAEAPEEAHSQELEVPEAPGMEQQEHTK